jgi:hypothetical protein
MSPVVSLPLLFQQQVQTCDMQYPSTGTQQMLGSLPCTSRLNARLGLMPAQRSGLPAPSKAQPQPTTNVIGPAAGGLVRGTLSGHLHTLAAAIHVL